MKKRIDSIMNIVDKIVEAMLFVVTITMLISGILQIVYRYLLNASLSWSEELMRYLYVWLTMIGASLAVRRKQFVTIEAVYNIINKKSPVAGKILTVVAIIMQVSFFIVLAIYGQQLAAKNMAAESPAMGLSMGIAYLALPLGGYLGCIYCLFELYDRFVKKEELTQ